MPETIMDMDLPLYCMAALCAIGVVGMFTTHLSYRRVIRHTRDEKTELREKWLNLWKTRDGLLSRMNRFVWYPSLLSVLILGAAVYLNAYLRTGEGLSLNYLYLGAAIPVALLLFRQGLDFTYREELLMHSLRDYVEEARRQPSGWEPEKTREPEASGTEAAYTVNRHTIHAGDAEVEDRLQREAAVEHITESIRQTAAAGSRFRGMLTPEEEEIMREVIREFLD